MRVFGFTFRPALLLTALALGLSPVAGAQPAPAAAPTPPDPARLTDAGAAMDFVERQYSRRPEPTAAQTRARRYGQGEVQYLLGDWRTASIIFQDLVSDPESAKDPNHPEALFFLADALYQQGNLYGARIYLRELLALETPRFQQALSRLLEINHQLGQIVDVEAWIARARARTSTGTLSPELAYAYARAVQRDRSRPKAQRIARVRELLQPLSQTPGDHQLAVGYMLGTLLVEERKLEQAAAHFAALTTLPLQTERDQELHTLALLAQGRVLYELGQLDEAIDRYNQVGRESPHYPDALYEIAWAFVQKEAYAQAHNATELLLVAAPESTLAPQAKLLQSNLLLKLARYDEANASYHDVIHAYAPVRDELEALLTVHRDPVAYFDELLSRNDRVMDVNLLLPEVARRYAATQDDVADGLRMINDLEVSREAIEESRHLAQRVRTALAQRGVEIFPDLQEGYLRADAVENAVLAYEHQQVLVEEAAAEPFLRPDERTRLAALRAQREARFERLEELPTSLQAVQQRQARLHQQLKELDRQAFAVGYEIQSAEAVARALRKLVRDTRGRKLGSAKDTEHFISRIEAEEALLEQRTRELARVRETLADERLKAGTDVAGEEQLKRELADIHAAARTLFEAVSARPEAAPLTEVMRTGGDARLQIASLRARAVQAKRALREKVAQRAERLHAQILAEERLLDAQAATLAQASAETRNLVGRLAFDSFKRIHRRFYELVLKADVGVVDVAFTRKQDHTAEIQRVASQKDAALRQLDRDFAGVLEEVRP